MNKYRFRHRELGKTDYIFKLLDRLAKKGFKIKCCGLTEYKPMWQSIESDTLLNWYTTSKEAWEYEKNLYKKSNEAAEELDRLIVEYLGDKE